MRTKTYFKNPLKVLLVIFLASVLILFLIKGVQSQTTAKVEGKPMPQTLMVAKEELPKPVVEQEQNEAQEPVPPVVDTAKEQKQTAEQTVTTEDSAKGTQKQETQETKKDDIKPNVQSSDASTGADITPKVDTVVKEQPAQSQPPSAPPASQTTQPPANQQVVASSSQSTAKMADPKLQEILDKVTGMIRRNSKALSYNNTGVGIGMCDPYYQISANVVNEENYKRMETLVAFVFTSSGSETAINNLKNIDGYKEITIPIENKNVRLVKEWGRVLIFIPL